MATVKGTVTLRPRSDASAVGLVGGADRLETGDDALAEHGGLGAADAGVEVVVVTEHDAAALNHGTAGRGANAVGHIHEREAAESARGVALRGDGGRRERRSAVIVTDAGEGSAGGAPREAARDVERCLRRIADDDGVDAGG